jgi:hypothetical protein
MTRRPGPLPEVLIGYLLSSPACRWPGADGILVEDVLRGYPAAASARLVPGELDLCDRHPELTVEIVALFFLLTVADAHHD